MCSSGIAGALCQAGSVGAEAIAAGNRGDLGASPFGIKAKSKRPARCLYGRRRSRLVVRNGQLFETGPITGRKGFFLLCAPSLDLSLSTPCVGEGLELLLKDESGWWIELGGAAGLAGLVVSPTLVKVLGGARVESSGSQAKDVEPSRHGGKAQAPNLRLQSNVPSTRSLRSLAQGYSPTCLCTRPEATSKRSASSGSGGRIRTYDQVINSHLDYHHK